MFTLPNYSWLGVGILIAITFVWWYLFVHANNGTIPMAPRRSLLFGYFPSILKAGREKNAHVAICELQNETGKLAAFKILSRTAISVADPECVKELFASHELFQKTPNLGIAMGEVTKGLLILEGEEWRRHRKLMTPAFNPNHLKQVVMCANEVTDRLIAKWTAAGPGAVVNVHSDMENVAMDVIGSAAFGVDFQAVLHSPVSATGHELASLIAFVAERVTMPRGVWKFLLSNEKQFRTIIAKISGFVGDIVSHRDTARRTAGEGDLKTLLDMMLDTRKDTTGGDAFTDEEIQHEVMMFFLAGHETSGNSMSWTLHLLSRNPEVQRRAQEEVDRELEGRHVTWDDLPRLEYLEQTIKESLRILPVVPFYGREAQESFVLNGQHHLPAGTLVFVNAIHIHHNAEFWPDPEKFDPDRFRKDRHIRPGTYLPFGDGPRVCIGQRLAMTEMKVVLARLLQRFSLEPCDDEIKAVYSITMGPKDGLKLKLVPRKHPAKMT